jgi:hypothetical protein
MTARFRPYAAALLVALAAIAILLAMGRTPICTCGGIALWVGERDSATTSQMIADWYSLSHVVHGFLFYAALALLLPRLAVGWRFAIAVFVEAAWEVFENTPWIIGRYREATAALGYNGDSVLNSAADIVMMALGFLAARKFPAWVSVAVVLALELVPLAVIRDNLTLNVLMLLAPSDALKAWQAGG